jgi:hypothetical protein
MFYSLDFCCILTQETKLFKLRDQQAKRVTYVETLIDVYCVTYLLCGSLG